MSRYEFKENPFFNAGRDIGFEMRGQKVAEAAMAEAAKDDMTGALRQYLFEHGFGLGPWPVRLHPRHRPKPSVRGTTS